MSRKYRLTLTENQLKVINEALEEYFRAPLGQWRALANRLAFRGFNWSDYTDIDFRKRCLDSEHAVYALEAAGNIALDRKNTNPRPTEEKVASDMWRILRWELMPEALKQEIPRDTYHESDEPPIQVEEI